MGWDFDVETDQMVRCPCGGANCHPIEVRVRRRRARLGRRAEGDRGAAGDERRPDAGARLGNGGGGSTNGLAGTNWVGANFELQTAANALTNSVAQTNWVAQNFQPIGSGGSATNAIALFGGLGTNTTLTNFNYLAGTNIYSATNRSIVASATTGFFTNLNSINSWSSNSTSTNVLAQSGYIGNEFDTNLTVVNDTWLNDSNMLLGYITGSFGTFAPQI